MPNYVSTNKYCTMSAKTSYPHPAMQYDIKLSLHQSPLSIIRNTLNTAGFDADSKGFGVQDLNKLNHSWVLTRMAFEFTQMPKLDDYNITTWVNEYGRLMTTRNFVMHNSKGEQFGSAVTQWAVIDLSTRRPVDLSELSNREEMMCTDPSPINVPLRLKNIEATQQFTHNVVYSDIDFNLHMNSLRYISIMYDTLPLELIKRHNMRMDINFLHESRFGDTLTIKSNIASDCAVFEIVNAESIAICRMSIEWR